MEDPPRTSLELIQEISLLKQRIQELEQSESECRQTEERLRESERRERERAEELAAMLEAVPTPVIIVHDPDATHMTGNRAADELLRQPRGAEASLSAPPERKPRHFKAFKDGRELRLDELPAQRAASGERVRDFEFSLVFDDNTTRHLLGYGTPLLDEKGRSRGAVHVLVDITGHKRAEEELRRSEERFRSYFELGLIGMAISSPAKSIIEVNDKLCEMLGYERSELLQMTWAELTYGDDLASDIAQFNRVLSGEMDGYSMDKRFVRKDGSIIDVTISVKGIRSAQGSVDYFVALLQDITERKRAEGNLAADLTALTRMHALSTKVLEEGGIKSVLQEIMDAAVAIVGAQKGTLQLVGSDSLHIVAHHGHDRPFLNFFAAAENVASICGEATKRAKRVIVEDVETSPILAGTPSLAVLRNAGVRAVQSTPLVNRKGELLGILTTQWGIPHVPDEHDLWRIDLLARQATEIVEHVRDQESLRQARDELEVRVEERTAELSEAYERLQAETEERRRLIAAVEQSIEGVLLLNAVNVEVRYANRAFLQLSGYAFDELIGRDVRILRGGQSGEASYKAMREKVATGKTWSGDYPLKRKDGSEVLVEITISPIKDADGALVSYVVTSHDVTKQRLLEAQLQQAQKMEALGTLAGGIAHDFNNMLAAIIGFTEMAADDVGDRPQAERSLQNVLKSAMRARDLVRQILTFSRKTSHQRSPMSLTPVIMDAVQLLRASIPTTIDIRLSVAASSDMILAAPVEVQQILINLVTNASVAMEEKGGPLEVSLTDVDFTPDSPILEPDVLPGEYVQLAVKDTGTGMSPEVMKRVFEPFFTTREVGKGTGMGLAVVFGIVKDLQGTVTVESELGAGSTFRVLLPKVKSEQDKEAVSTASAPGGTERILFVDDEEMLVEWGQAVLERLGYSVTAATDSREALKVFSSDPTRFDLVITDHTMPAMSGAQLTKALRKVRADIPIILCTGNDETVSPDTVKKVGIRQLLMKPLARLELAEAVRLALDTHKGK
jgi:PAS domain S-box-containing protein